MVPSASHLYPTHLPRNQNVNYFTGEADASLLFSTHVHEEAKEKTGESAGGKCEQRK